MALYTIEHSCGHSEQAQVYGTNAHGERDRKLSQMASQPCKACRRAAGLAAAESWERQVGITERMGGSEKQVDWARRIRHAAVADVVARTRPAYRDGFIRYIASKPASYWIDGRPAGITVAKEYAEAQGGADAQDNR